MVRRLSEEDHRKVSAAIAAAEADTAGEIVAGVVWATIDAGRASQPLARVAATIATRIRLGRPGDFIGGMPPWS